MFSGDLPKARAIRDPAHEGKVTPPLRKGVHGKSLARAKVASRISTTLKYSFEEPSD